MLRDVSWSKPSCVVAVISGKRQTTRGDCHMGAWSAVTIWRVRQCLLMEIKNGAALLKMELPHNSAIPVLGLYMEKTIIQKDTCAPMFIAALFTVAKTWKQPRCPSANEWINVWYIYTMEYYSAIKKDEIMPLVATWMDLEIIILSEISQTKTNTMWYHLYVESRKMVQMNLFTK